MRRLRQLCREFPLEAKVTRQARRRARIKQRAVHAGSGMNIFQHASCFTPTDPPEGSVEVAEAVCESEQPVPSSDWPTIDAWKSLVVPESDAANTQEETLETEGDS